MFLIPEGEKPPKDGASTAQRGCLSLTCPPGAQEQLDFVQDSCLGQRDEHCVCSRWDRGHKALGELRAGLGTPGEVGWKSTEGQGAPGLSWAAPDLSAVLPSPLPCAGQDLT